MDFESFAMADYYGPVLATLTNATGVTVWCDADYENFNETAVLRARASYFASDMIFRGRGDDIETVAERIVGVLTQAVVMTSRFSKRVKALIRAQSGGRTLTRKLRATEEYWYNASSAIQFVDAADIFNVSASIIGTIGPTSVPTSEPTSCPTLIPSPDPTSVPSSVPTQVPTISPTSIPTSVPTPVCPTWANMGNCDDPNCLCCTSYNVTRDVNGTLRKDGADVIDARKANKPGTHRCLMCQNDFDCIDVDDDGDGECVANPTNFTAGNNLCDWWLWAWYYGDNVPGQSSPNGHSYAADFSLNHRDSYIIGGSNCSYDRVDVINDDAAGRTFADENSNGALVYHGCHGIFSFGNDTRYASGSPDHDHDREGSVCYKDYRDPDYRGYCSYQVGPAACVRCSPYAFDDLIMSSTLTLSISSGQTAEDLNNDENFKKALRTTIFYAAGLDQYPLLNSAPGSYVKDLEFVDADNNRRRLLSISSVNALYNLVVAASGITLSATDFYDNVENLADTAVTSGTFGSLLTVYLTTFNVTAVTLNVTSLFVEVTQTVPPTYWSLTADVAVPPVIQNRLSGDILPPCGCENDEL